MSCPASGRLPEGHILIEGDDGPARLGTAVHEVLAAVVSTGELPDGHAVAVKYNADPDEVERLVSYGMKAWGELQQYYPGAVVEQHLTDGTLLSGHADVLSVSGNAAAILDWKSGYLESDASQQMTAYAFLASCTVPDTVTEFMAVVVYLRSRTYRIFRYTVKDLDAWAQNLQDVIDGPELFRPGSHCLYCKRHWDCPARAQMIRQTIAELGGDGEQEITVDLYRRARAAQAMAEEFKELVKEHILIHGPIESDGARLEIKTESRDKIDPLAAWPYFTKYGLTQQEIAEAVRVSKTELLSQVGNHAPARGKGAFKAQFMEELNEAGCVEKSEIQKLVEVRL